MQIVKAFRGKAFRVQCSELANMCARAAIYKTVLEMKRPLVFIVICSCLDTLCTLACSDFFFFLLGFKTFVENVHILQMRAPERAAFCPFARRVYFEIHFIKNGRRAHSKMSDIHSVMCSKLNCVYFSSLPLAASRGSAMFPCELRKFDAEYAEASRWSSVFARFDRMNLFRISLFGQMLPRKI